MRSMAKARTQLTKLHQKPGKVNIARRERGRERNQLNSHGDWASDMGAIAETER